MLELMRCSVCCVMLVALSTVAARGQETEETDSESTTRPVAEATDEAPELSRFTESIPGTRVTIEMIEVPRQQRDDDKAALGGFWMSVTEIPWEVYDIYLFEVEEIPQDRDDDVDAVSRPSNPHIPPDCGFGHDGYPTISISGLGARSLCEWLSALTGRTWRLPTEAEWEYVARSGADRFAPDDVSTVAWCKENAELTPHPVGKKEASAWGFHDLLGNAAEWCVAEGDELVLRGGSFQDEGAKLLSLDRKVPTEAWQMTDPQIPKSEWWLSDAPFAGLRIVCEEPPATSEQVEEEKKR